MANKFQLFLSSRPPRSVTAHDKEVKGIYHSCHAWFKHENGHNYVYEEHYTSSHPKAQGGLKSESGTPGHIHLYQNEYFDVIEGTLGIIRDGKVSFVKPGDATACVQTLSRHRFWPHEGGDKTGNVILRVRVDEYPGGLDERFIRNVFSYTSDCEKYQVAPSGPQLMLFLYSHDMVLDLPLPIFLLKIMHWFLAYVVGAWLLGYQESYPEYYDEAAPPFGKKEL